MDLRSFETSVSIYQPIERNIPQDWNLWKWERLAPGWLCAECHKEWMMVPVSHWQQQKIDRVDTFCTPNGRTVYIGDNVKKVREINFMWKNYWTHNSSRSNGESQSQKLLNLACNKIVNPFQWTYLYGYLLNIKKKHTTLSSNFLQVYDIQLQPGSKPVCGPQFDNR
jgi:hypothetical protein